MRVRILEAFARGLPVVTTTVGLEGIDAISGRDVLVADGASEFADAVLRLLDDPGLREQIGRRGRALVEREYDWNVVLARMGKIYNGLSDFRNLS
jgi:glycosyltransferase involved in cell wall biosynthesis